jgi:hypothetical protein
MSQNNGTHTTFQNSYKIKRKQTPGESLNAGQSHRERLSVVLNDSQDQEGNSKNFTFSHAFENIDSHYNSSHPVSSGRNEEKSYFPIPLEQP